jgi:hypothetical protein
VPVAEGTTITQPVGMPRAEIFAVPVSSPETIEESPYEISIRVRTRY